MTLRARIAAVAGLAVAVAVLGSAAIIYWTVGSELRGEVDAALRQRARALVSPEPGAPRAPLAGPDRERYEQHEREEAERYGGAAGLVRFVSANGPAEPREPAVGFPLEPGARRIAARGSGEYLSQLDLGATHLRVLTLGAGRRGAVQVARPLNEIDNVLERLLVILAAVGLGGVALAAALGAIVAKTALTPIERFTRRTESVAADPDLSHRMEVTGRDELARLARSFNATLDELERAVDAQRQLVADASHELRTPIASLRANIQLLDDADRLPPAELDGLRADILGELDELTALIGDLVELARGEGEGDSREEVRLDLIVAALADRATRRAPSGQLLECRLDPTVVTGDPERIGRAVSNLIDNALKWSPPGGTIVLELREGVVSVRDQGPGFPSKDLPFVFERFFRSDGARATSGSGLGLAIVRQAADAHRGWVEAANASPGGAVVRIGFGPWLQPEGELEQT